MENLRLTELFNLAIAKIITRQERDELFDLMSDPSNEVQLEELFASAWDNFNYVNSPFSIEKGATMLRRVLTNDDVVLHEEPEVGKYHFAWLTKILAAASIILVASIVIYLYRQSGKVEKMTLAQAAEQSNILPGSEKAILTLGDGREVILDNVQPGLLAEEEGVSIKKLAGGQITYYEDKTVLMEEKEKLSYNSIVVPRGGHYKLVLPDGTKVHLNSESSMRYPSKFKSDVRNVEFVGEAYFEVVHNEKQPFYVKTTSQVTEVLGTVFNISAYKDAEVVATTLVEGSINIIGKHGNSLVVKPGQTAFNKVDKLNIKNVDMDGMIAWHNGYFVFSDEDIKSIMQKVSRWYNIDVEYIGDVSNKRFGGVFQRSKSIVKLLNSFKQTGIIDFKIEERRVVVIEK